MDVHRSAHRALSLFVVTALTAIAAAASAKGAGPIPSGYQAVPIRYGSLNKMLISVSINGHPATLLVDTAANQILIDAARAQSLGITPSHHGLRYIGTVAINGQPSPIAFARSVSAGPVDFGSRQVVLLNSNSTSDTVDGTLGADLLVARKAVIDCYGKRIYFKPADSSGSSSFVAPSGFTRVAMRREENGGFTVPASLRGQSLRLLVDTGGPVTTFNDATLNSLGVPMQATAASSRFTPGTKRPMSLAEVPDFTIGNFKVRSTRVAASALPAYALHQGQTQIAGLIGIELLVACHAIIDLGSMNLYLK